MSVVRTEIDIDAPDDVVWGILTGFAAYPEWNPYITSAAGKIKKGNKLELRIEPPGGSARTITPVVTRLEQGLELRWESHIYFPGLFNSEHVLEVAWMGAHSTHVRNWERFGGLLSVLGGKGMQKKARRGFEAMNKALKQRAEERVRA